MSIKEGTASALTDVDVGGTTSSSAFLGVYSTKKKHKPETTCNTMIGLLCLFVQKYIIVEHLLNVAAEGTAAIRLSFNFIMMSIFASGHMYINIHK